MRIAVCFIGGNGLGDTLLVTPVLKALRAKFPHANIGCLMQHIFLLTRNPHLDQAYEWSMYSREGYDNLYYSAELRLFVNYTQHHHRLDREHVCDVMAALCGVSLQDKQLDIFLDPHEDLLGYRIVRNVRVNTHSRYVVAIHTGASTPNREWIDNNWDELVRSFPHVVFIQVGGEEDTPVNSCISLCGQYSPRETIAIIKYCDAVIAVDSFINHAAAAVGTPGIILFGSSDPSGFGHPSHINLIDRNLDCVPCYRPVVWAGDVLPVQIDINQPVPWVCSHRNCMHLLTVQKVKVNLERLLAQAK